MKYDLAHDTSVCGFRLVIEFVGLDLDFLVCSRNREKDLLG